MEIQLLDLIFEINSLPTNWKNELNKIFCINNGELSPKIKETQEYINNKKTLFKGKIGIYPPNENIFKAFSYFDFTDTKVVILGQDPYHQPGQAMGLSFSVPKGVKIPPSLVNIFKELKKDSEIKNYKIPDHGDLTSWAKQGVLLLNAALTVQQSKASSHSKKWNFITDEIIKHISDNLQGVVFMLWGNYAKNKSPLIDAKKHLILTAIHPSPLSANRGWFGNGGFSKTNKYLTENGKTNIKW